MPLTFEDSEGRNNSSKAAKSDRVAREVKKIQLVLRSKGLSVPQAPSAHAQIKKPATHAVRMHGRNLDGTKRDEAPPPSPTLPSLEKLPALLDIRLQPSELQQPESFPQSITSSSAEPLFFKPTPKTVPVFYRMLEERRVRELNEKVHRDAVEDFIPQHARAEVAPLPLYMMRQERDAGLPSGPPLSVRYPKIPSAMLAAIESRHSSPRDFFKQIEESNESTSAGVYSEPSSPLSIRRDQGSPSFGARAHAGNYSGRLPAVVSSSCDAPYNEEEGKEGTANDSTFARQMVCALRSRPHYKDNGTRLSHVFALSPTRRIRLDASPPLHGAVRRGGKTRTHTR